MDILSKDQSINLNCSIHPNNRVQFIQIKDIQENKSLFYCLQCQNEDDDYRVSNYILIDNILQHNNNQILDKWPPLSDISLNKKMKEYCQQDNSKSKLSSQIDTFFENLKLEIIKKIDDIKKKMMNNSQQFPDNKSDILEKYQNISKIKNLKQIIFDENADCKEKQNEYKKLIKDLTSQSKINSETFQQVISKYELSQNLIDFQNAENIKSSVIKLIDQINIFSLDKDSIDQLNNVSKSELLFDLISTKPNYCSETFLSSIKSLFNQISPLIQNISFEEVFIKYKKPIDFSKINNQQIEEIRDLCEYYKKMQDETEEQMKNNDKIKQIMGILKQKSNNLNGNFLIEFEKYLIQTYHFLNKVKFDQIFLSKQNIQLSSHITRTPPPIIRNSQKQIDILPSIQMIKTDYEQSQQILQIEKNKQNNSISISLSQNCIYDQGVNCVSDLILDENTSYVFRFQFIYNSQVKNDFNIGLIRDSQKDLQPGCLDYLTCYFRINQNSFYCGGNGIDKKEKGDFSGLKSQEIEMRVCIKDNILQILDYPNYNHILSLQDIYKNNLKQSNLRLYIGLWNSNIKIQIMHASKNK